VFVNDRAGAEALATAAVGGGASPVILKERVVAGPAKWSPKGDAIAYRMPDSLSLISPTGKNDRVLSKRKWGLYTWSKDGNEIYALRSDRQHYTLAAIAVPGGSEKTLAEFDLPPGSRLGDGLSLAPGGKSVGVTLYKSTADIWLLEDFLPPVGFFKRFWRW